MPSWPGEYRYDPCGRATRFKQFAALLAVYLDVPLGDVENRRG